jgi:hypothetical protein
MKTRSLLTVLIPLLLFASEAGTRAQNLIVNPDFNAGNAGFATEYTHSPTDIVSPQTYAILTSPSSAHGSFSNMGDHTTGTGNMMVVNGAVAADPSPVVWSQQVTVEANCTYFFSTWAANVLGGSPSRFVFRINGVILQPQVVLPNEAALWQNYTTTWISGLATTALLEIIFVSTDEFGNDSALDDLVFRKASSDPIPVAIAQAVWLEWNSVLGVDYQIQSSVDLVAWINVGLPVGGTGSLMTHSEKAVQPKKFFRVIGLAQ